MSLPENNQIALDNWIKQLSETDMPVFSGTVMEVSEVVENDNSSASDVARVILKDASLTSRLLKAVNNFYFNPSGKKINTISRAITVMGFKEVKTLTLSLLLIDDLKQGQNRDKLVAEMAKSFHAAVQANEFSLLEKKSKSKSNEDLFVATLVSQIGKMVFWAYAGEQADLLIKQIEAGIEPETAEQSILGFTIADLTKALCAEWKLGDVVRDYLDGSLNEKQAKYIELGNSLAEVTEQGWEAEESEAFIEDWAEKLGLPLEQFKEIAFDNAGKAKDVTNLYGSHQASSRIPIPGVELPTINSSLNVDQESIDDEMAEPVPETDKVKELISEEELSPINATKPEPIVQTELLHPQADNDYQVAVLQEIADTVKDKQRPSIGIVLEMVLEGIHRGIGTDRAMFMILNPERTRLLCKYVIGEGADQLLKSFAIDIRSPDNVFSQTIHKKKPRLISNSPQQLGGTLSKTTLQKLGNPPYILMPTIVRNKVIGLFMADRSKSKRVIDEADFLSFQDFCQQANNSLTILTQQG